MGAMAPFGYSADGSHLVAAVRDGASLAVWDTSTHRRLRRLENSDRHYALVVISDDAQWIAAVRLDQASKIDLWQASSGRHLRVIEAAGGRKSQLDFVGSDVLRVQTASGRTLEFAVPSGLALGGAIRGEGSALATPPSFRTPSGGGSSAAQAPRKSRAVRSAPRIPIAPVLPDVGEAAPQHAPPVEAPTFDLAAPGTAAPSITDGSPELTEEAPPAPEAVVETPAEPDLALDDIAAEPPVSDWPTPAAPPAPRATMSPGSSGSGGATSASPVDLLPDLSPPSGAAPYDPAGGAAPDMVSDEAPPEPASAAPDEVSSESPAEPAPEPAAAAPAVAPRQFRFEMPAEAAQAPASAAPADVEPMIVDAAPPAPEPVNSELRFEIDDEPAPTATASTRKAAVAAPTPRPNSVNIHFATNRNLLAPKDRAWSVYFVGFFSSLPAFIIYGLMVLSLLVLPWLGKRSWAINSVLSGLIVLCGMATVEAYVRSQLRDQLSGELYGSRPTDLSYGICEVSVPRQENRKAGDLSRPTAMWVFEAPENPDKHFMLRRVEENSDKSVFYTHMAAELAEFDENAALLFIHGYNCSFEDAVFRTAQLAVDLKFPGVAVTFSWPSYADPVKYPFDEQNAEVSIPALREVLDDLATRGGAKRVHIIAHSMGNRVLAGALRSMDEATQARNREVFHELVLAAPDIDRRVFETQILPHIVRSTQHCTLYASSRDRALLLSRMFHNYQRLGETQPELLLAGGVETIDASTVDTSLLGHSYIGDVQSIVSDLHDLVVAGKTAAERIGLEELKRNARLYWTIKPHFNTASSTHPSQR